MSTVSSASSSASIGNNGLSRVLVPLIFGHTSERLSRPTVSGHTHRWTVYVRAPGPIQFQDRSFIKKVVFNLHESFDNPIRVLKDPPFEVTETGYGGFTMPIKLQFNGIEKIYSINYELILSLEKFCETNIEQIIELRNPSKELATLVQKYCPKKKDAAKEKTMVFSKSNFSLTKPPKASVSIGKNGHEMTKTSNRTETKAIEETVSNKEKEKTHPVLERKDTDFFASAVAPSVPTRPSSKASDSSAPESSKSTNEKTRKIINCLFSEHDSASEEPKMKKSKKSDKSKEESKKKKKMKEIDGDSAKEKLFEKSNYKLTDVGDLYKSEKSSKHEGDRVEKTSKPFQKSDFIFKEKSEKISKTKTDESEKSEGKKGSKKARKVDDESSKESKLFEKSVLKEKPPVENFKTSEKSEKEMKDAKSESKSSELKESKEKVKEKKPKNKLSTSSLAFSAELSKPEERPSISIKLQKPSEDAMDVLEPEPSVSSRQEDTSESLRRDKSNVELVEGKQSPIEVKRKYIDIKTEPNSPCRFASDWHKRPHSSISLEPPPYNDSSPVFFEQSNYATTPSSAPTTPRIPSSSLSNEEDDSRHDEESGGGSVVEKNWSINSESPSSKYEYRLQQLMEQLHSIQDPDLLYRCADTLIEYDATAVNIDECGQMDFDLYHVKKETVALLEEIFASLTPLSR